MQVNERLKDKYLAGMWQHNLEKRLLWSSLRPRITHVTRDYVAPSWSWASLDGPIDWKFSGTPEIEILHCEVVPVSLNAPYGAISSGFLSIRGRVMHGLFQLGNDGGLIMRNSSLIMNIQFWPDTDEFFIAVGAEGTKSFYLTVLLLVLAQEHGTESNYYSHYGLVLREDQSKATYRRVGTCRGPTKWGRDTPDPWTFNFEWRNITII
jgi:hypothetical protein